MSAATVTLLRCWKPGRTAFQQRSAFNQKVEEREGRTCFFATSGRWPVTLIFEANEDSTAHTTDWGDSDLLSTRRKRRVELRVSQETACHSWFPQLSGYRAKTLAFKKCTVSHHASNTFTMMRGWTQPGQDKKSECSSARVRMWWTGILNIFFLAGSLAPLGRLHVRNPEVFTHHVYKNLFQVHCVKYIDGSQIVTPSLRFIFFSV